MTDNELEVSTELPERKKGISSSTKTFIIGTAIWSSFFIIIPLIIFLVVRDWTVTLSITGKIGIGFVLLGFVLLGVVGTPKVTGGVAGMTFVEYSNSEEESTSNGSEKTINFMEILSIGSVMVLLWGAIYLIPFAFGIPFML